MMDLSLSERVSSAMNSPIGQIFFMIMFFDSVMGASNLLIYNFLVLKKVSIFFAVSEVAAASMNACELSRDVMFFSLATSQRPLMWSMSSWLIITVFMADMPRWSRKGLTIFLPMLARFNDPQSNKIFSPWVDWASIVWP